MPTAPRPITKCMQLFYSTPTLTNKIVPLAAEAPRHLLGAKSLVRQIDKPVAPGLGPNTLRMGLLAPFPPVAGVPTHISGAPHRANINNSGLLYRPPPVAASCQYQQLGSALPSAARRRPICPSNRNPLEIITIPKYLLPLLRVTE